MNTASRYAKAWMEEALQNGSVDEALRDIATITSTVDGSRDLSLFLKNPIHSRGVKQSVLDEIFKGKVSTQTMNVLNLLVAKGRVGELHAICTSFTSQHQKASGIVEASVSSPIALSQDEQNAVAKALETSLKKRVILTAHVDPSLIGGIKVRIGDQVVDGSVRHQLDVLRDRFTTQDA